MTLTHGLTHRIISRIVQMLTILFGGHDPIVSSCINKGYIYAFIHPSIVYLSIALLVQWDMHAWMPSSGALIHTHSCRHKCTHTHTQDLNSFILSEWHSLLFQYLQCQAMQRAEIRSWCATEETLLSWPCRSSSVSLTSGHGTSSSLRLTTRKE